MNVGNIQELKIAGERCEVEARRETGGRWVFVLYHNSKTFFLFCFLASPFYFLLKLAWKMFVSTKGLVITHKGEKLQTSTDVEEKRKQTWATW